MNLDDEVVNHWEDILPYLTLDFYSPTIELWEIRCVEGEVAIVIVPVPPDPLSRILEMLENKA